MRVDVRCYPLICQEGLTEKKCEKPVRKASVLTAMLCSFVEKYNEAQSVPFHCRMMASFDCVLVVLAMNVRQNTRCVSLQNIGRLKEQISSLCQKLLWADLALPLPSACRV